MGEDETADRGQQLLAALMGYVGRECIVRVTDGRYSRALVETIGVVNAVIETEDEDGVVFNLSRRGGRFIHTTVHLSWDELQSVHDFGGIDGLHINGAVLITVLPTQAEGDG